MKKICIPKQNWYGRKSIIEIKPSKRTKTSGIKSYSTKYFTKYSVGVDDIYIPKKNIKIRKCD